MDLAFPDLTVHMDDFRRPETTPSSPGHSKARRGDFVRIGGWEEWLHLLVRESLGIYDTAEYDRQVANGR